MSGFPVLVIGVSEKGEMAFQAGDSVFLWNVDITHTTMQCQNQALQNEQSPTMKTWKLI